MPLAPQTFLQASAAAKPRSDSPGQSPVAATQPRDQASSFAQVFKDKQQAPAKVAENPAKANREQPVRKDNAVADKDAAAKPAVADSGKPLPADKPAAAEAGTGEKTDDSQASPADMPLADTAVPPVVDPSLLQAAAPSVDVTPGAVAAQLEESALVIAAPMATTTLTGAVQAESDFDPASDPLDNLPALRLAMEQGGHISASTQAAQKTVAIPQEPQPAQGQAAVVAPLLEQQADGDGASAGGEKAFSGLLEDGLKDLNSASSDTRVDDFANRLAALTQAAVPKTANALPVNQPLAMHQAGWTEEVVNRVMYLSSANLKSAEIQLEPAELGRLDIRVNMAADQPAQINFVSGHAGVREALEGNMFRLREMLQQQGLAQADVNVSDQARGWAGQGQDQAQQQQAHKGGNGAGSRLDGTEDELSVAAANEAQATVSPTQVLGSSAVDYYA